MDRNSEAVTTEKRSILKDIHHSLVNLIQCLHELVKLPKVVPIMTYDSAIKYFVAERPNGIDCVKGAILRQPHMQGQLLFQTFLDRNNSLIYQPNGKPYGRQLVVKELDRELKECFGEYDLLVVE